MAILAVVVSTSSQLLLKLSVTKVHSSHITEYLNPYVIIGYGMMFLSLLLNFFALRFGIDNGFGAKHAPVVESLGYVLIMFAARIFFKEKITVKKVVGNGLIVIGIIVFCLNF